jgi:tetratricopeptide (TPR) repeat protein
MRLWLFALIAIVAVACGERDPRVADRLCRGAATGSPEQQVRACDEVLRLIGDTPRARSAILSWRGEAKERAGDLDGALEDFKAALELWEDAPNALLGAGRVLLKQGDLSGAETYLRRSIHVHDSGIASDMLGAYFLQQGDNASARREYDALLSRQEDNVYGLYGRGVARLRAGDEGGQMDVARARTLYKLIDSDFEWRGITAP